MHRTFKELGRELSNEWGFDDDGDLANMLKTMQNDKRVMCLLAAVVDELRELRRAIPMPKAVPEAGEPSDGMIEAIRLLANDKKVRPFPKWLSVRARKALSRQSIVYMSEITPERFVGQRNCGQKTIEELMKFKQECSC